MADQTAAGLDAALRAAGMPIDGVTVGDPADRSTWWASFPVGVIPTDAQRASVAQVIATWSGPVPYLTGGDIIDGMSPAQASGVGVDVRDLMRIQAAPTAAEVKSKLARVEKALKLAPGTLAGQATPSGGM